MYSEKYNKLFWGLVITLFDFRIMGFNILPDLIGYIIIISALLSLQSHHKGYGKAKMFAIVLLVLSVTDIYQIDDNILNGFTVNTTTIIFMIISSITVILDILMVYFIINTILELALSSNFDELYETAQFRWKAYLIINSIFLLVSPFMINVPEDIVILIIIPLTLIVMIIKIMFIGLIRQVSKVY